MTKQQLTKFIKGLGASSKFFLGAFIISTTSFIYIAFAAPPTSPYNLGETLAPTCVPGDTNCTVDTPQEGNAYLTDIAGITADQGDLIYFNGTNWVELGAGTSGQFLQTQGASADPVWSTPAGAGNVSYSGTPIVNDFARFVDGTDIEGRSYTEVKTDLSLNNVENTALSTWIGTSNIATLGTIGTGTWQGAAIDQTYLVGQSGTNTGDETTQRIGTLINGATAKTTPVDADMIGLMDSAAGNILKKLSWVNIKSTLKTYFDTLYAATLGSDDNYVTDAEKVVIGNTSGTNTGDQTISDATISTTDITTNDATTAKHGFLPKLGGGTINFLRADGIWTVPSTTTVWGEITGTLSNQTDLQTVLNTKANLAGGVVFNESGANVDFRVESDTNANMFFVDAENNRVGIGTDLPIHKFQVSGGNNTGRILIHDNEGHSDDEAGLLFAVSADLSTNPAKGGIFFNRDESHGRGDLLFSIDRQADSAEVTKNDAKMAIKRSGDVRIGLGDNPIHLNGEGELYVDQYLEVKKSIYVGSGITHISDVDTYIDLETDDSMGFYTGGIRMFDIIEGVSNFVVINENSADVDFRIESETNANMFFMDAERNVIGIGTGEPFLNVGSDDGDYRHVSGLHIAELTAGESGGLVVEGDENAFIDLVDRGSEKDDKIMRILNSEGNLFFHQLADSVVDIDFTWMTFERHGNVGIGTDSPTVIFEVACPSGFTNIKGGNNQLGCIQTAEEGTDSYEKAQNNCFNTYGGRLPTTGELFIAMNNYDLTDEIDDWERCDDHIYEGGDNQHSVAARGDISTQSGSDDVDTIDYRCWLPR